MELKRKIEVLLILSVLNLHAEFWYNLVLSWRLNEI